MGSIINLDGRWRAQVRRKGYAAQCRTFDKKAEAQAWVNERENAIASGAPITAQVGTLTVGDVLDAYCKMRDKARPIADTSNEHYMLKSLKKGLGKIRVSALNPQDLVAYATMRRDEDGAGPYTVNMDISKLGTAMRYGGAALKIAMPDVVGSARPLLNHLRLIGGGGKRERRPTEDELRRILDEIGLKRGKLYAEALAFSAITAMRRGEVCAILRKDIDPVKRCVGVWRKHPRKAKVWELVPLIGEAWDIAMRQPENPDGRVFPLHISTLSKYFTWTCRDLSIMDLHLHDLRHEGTSRLFEEGYSIEQVALVTGHKSWANLRRYTNLKPEDVHKRKPLTPPSPEPRQSTKPRRDSLQSASRTPRKS